MKFINHLYAKFVSENERVATQQNNDLNLYFKSKFNQILKLVLGVCKENLNQLLETEEGLYCVLFINNCMRMLMLEEDAKQTEEALNLIWQDMHVVMSKLT